jgi:quercetin dioxygenase-like cupin family protein
MRSRSPRRPALLALAACLAAAAAGGAYAAVDALDGQLPQRQPVNSGRPGKAPGQILELVRVTIPPGGTLAPHRHPGMQIVYVESGSIRYTVVAGSIKVRRAALADGTAGPVEVVRAGQTVDVNAGDSLVETRHMVHAVANSGTQPAVLLDSSLFDADRPAVIAAGTP